MPESGPENPFAVLGMAPTEDLGAIKRAYFAQLALHPPQSDPAGFQRLRQAYEALQTPADRAVAISSAPFDMVAELARWEATYRARLDSIRGAARDQANLASRLQRFIDATSRMTLDEARRTYADKPLEEPGRSGT